MPELDSSTKSTPVIVIDKIDGNITQIESYQVHPAPKQDECYFTLRHSELKSISKFLKSVENRKFPWDELCGFIAAIGFGGTLGAATSHVLLDSFLGIIYFVVLPIVSFSLSVFVVMFKIQNIKENKFESRAPQQIINNYLESDVRNIL